MNDIDMKDIDTRISPSLHPGYFSDMEDPIINQVVGKFSTIYEGMRKLYKARDEATKSPLLTKDAAILKVADLADKTTTTVTKSIDSARETLEKATKFLQEEMNKSFENNRNPDIPQIREHFKSLDHKDRHSFLRKSIERKDTDTLRAVLSGPAYLSGFSPEEQRVYTRQANKALNPDKFSRLLLLEKAAKRLDTINVLTVNNQIENALGTNWQKVNQLREKQARLKKAFE